MFITLLKKIACSPILNHITHIHVLHMISLNIFSLRPRLHPQHQAASVLNPPNVAARYSSITPHNTTPSAVLLSYLADTRQSNYTSLFFNTDSYAMCSRPRSSQRHDSLIIQKALSVGKYLESCHVPRNGTNIDVRNIGLKVTLWQYCCGK